MNRRDFLKGLFATSVVVAVASPSTAFDWAIAQATSDDPVKDLLESLIDEFEFVDEIRIQSRPDRGAFFAQIYCSHRDHAKGKDHGVAQLLEVEEESENYAPDASIRELVAAANISLKRMTKNA